MDRRASLVVVALALAACGGAQPSASPPRDRPTIESPTPSPSPTPSAIASSDPRETPTPRLTPTPEPRSTPTPTPDPAYGQPASPDGWRPALPADLVTSNQWSDVVWTGDRFVAVGPTFIESTDGIHWSAETTDPSWNPWSIDLLDGAVYANGLIGETGATWRSADGEGWAPAATIPGQDVVVDDRGWVAVGTDGSGGPCASDCPPGRGRAWTSTDGSTWKTAPRQSSLNAADLRSVIAAKDGYVAAGTVGWGEGALWISPDGMRWTRLSGVKLGASDYWFYVGGLDRIDDTLVLVGMDSGQDASRARVYWSTDGRAWHPATVDAARNGQMFSVTSTGRELLATGPSSACLGGIWSSTTGRSWACVANGKRIAPFGPYAAAGSPTVEVAVGLTDANSGDDGLPGAIWWRPAPRP